MENLKDAFDEIGDGMIPMKPIMRAAQKPGSNTATPSKTTSRPCRASKEPASFEFMIRKRFLSSGFSLVFLFTQKSKTYSNRFDDLKADALGCLAAKLPKLPTPTNWPGRHAFENAYCQGTVCRSFPGKFHARTLPRGKGNYLGRTFSKNGYSSTRVGKIFHMRYRETSSQEPMATTHRHVGRPNTTCLEKRLTPREITLA